MPLLYHMTAAYNDGSLNGTLKTASVVGKEDTAAGVFAVQATGRDGRHSHAMRTTVRVAISSRLLVVARELAYKPYFFSQRIIFFSHNKSANSTFSHDLSVKRTGQIVLEFEPCMDEFYTFICASVIDSISVIIVMEFR